MAIDQILKQIPAEEGFDIQTERRTPATLRIRPRELRADVEGVWRALVLLAIHAATTPAQRRLLTGRRSLAAVVRVPSAAWVTPVADLLHSVGSFGHVFAEAATRRPTGQNDLDRITGARLSSGERVLGVSNDPARLPCTLVAAADLAVTIAPPGASVLETLIRIVTGQRAPGPAIAAEGLDFDHIVSAVRRGSTPADCKKRLERAHAIRRSGDGDLADAPALEDLHGYGAAMEWSKALLADLAEWRAGRAAFPVGTARAVFAGPPGTGKTSLVRAIAKASALPLVSTSMARWFADSPGYLDSVIKAIDAVFARARAVKPAILFIDEFDGIPDRSTMSARAAEFWTPVVGHLLTTLDSACSDATAGLVVIGATNYAHRLDDALVRPGRLERVIEIRPPEDPAVRASIVRSHLRGDLAESDLSAIALATAGATGATLMALVRDARRRARAAGRDLALADLLALAVPHDGRTDAEDRRCAVHEAGHAACALAMGIEITLISLVATRSTAASVHMTAPNTLSVTRADLTRRVVVLLGGLAAEEIVFGERSIGAGGTHGSDLAQATHMLTDAHAIQGLGERLSYTPPYAGVPGERLAALVEREMQNAFAEAQRIVATARPFIDALADRLLSRRVLSGEEVGAIHRDTAITPARPRRGRARRPTAAGGRAGPTAISRQDGTRATA